MKDYVSLTTGKLDANAMIENGKYPFFTCSKDPYKIDKYAFASSALLVSGNGSQLGHINYYNGKFNAYQRTYILHEFKISSNYIKQYLHKNLKKQIDRELSAGNIPYIKLDTINCLKTNIPNNDGEINKVANLLSKIDILINEKEKENFQLEKFQKYLIDSFSQMDINTKNSTYKPYILKDIAGGIYDGPHVTPKYSPFGVPFISVENINEQYHLINKFVSVNDYELEKKRTDPSQGDILISRIGTIGITRQIDFNDPICYYVTLALIKKSNFFNSNYLEYILKSTIFKKELHKRTLHVAFPQKINLSELGNCSINLPNIFEQEKIGTLFKKNNSYIQKNKFDLENYNKIKTYILSKMLV